MLGYLILIIVLIITYMIFQYYKQPKYGNYPIEVEEEESLESAFDSVPDFNPDHATMAEDFNYLIACDNKRRKMCLIVIGENGEDETIVVGYRDILSVEFLSRSEMSGETITKTSRKSQIGGAILGGLIAGPAGMVIGGLSGKKISYNEINERIDLHIVINNTAHPSILLNFCDSYTESNDIISKHEEAREWYARLQSWIEQADREDNQKKQNAIPQGNTTNTLTSELKEIAALKESGVLTESEFQELKQKILKKY
jgi:hypothetical protein